MMKWKLNLGQFPIPHNQYKYGFFLIMNFNKFSALSGWLKAQNKYWHELQETNYVLYNATTKPQQEGFCG